MHLTIRPARAADYRALAESANAAFPGVPHTAEELQIEDTRDVGMATVRLVAEQGDRVVGTVSYFQSPVRFHPQKFWMDEWVHPDWQGQGIGTALFDRVMTELAPREPIMVRTFTREDLPHSIRFFERRGFTEQKRSWASYLDVPAFDFTPYAGVEERVAAQGIRICTLATLQARPDWERPLLDLYNAIQQDVPDIDPPTPLTLEQFVESRLNSAQLLPEGYFLALDGDRWVGSTSLWKGTLPDTFTTGLTGVLPAYRGRGIALALKIRSIAYAASVGCKQIRTTNASTNRPMLTINDRLGYVKEYAWIHMIREF